MVDPDRKPKAEVWSGLVSAPVTKLDVLDVNNDTRRDIELTTASGRVYLDFDGRIIRTKGAQFELSSPKRD